MASPAFPPSRYDLSAADLSSVVCGASTSGGLALPPYRARQIWHGLYAEGREFDEMTTLPKTARAALVRHRSLRCALTLSHESVSDEGDTMKWLWNLEDGRQIETVLMHYPDRSTVCISTQAGCAMGCGFCATGQGGFDRHLTSGEIVEQVVRARRRAADDGRRLSNVVFMGMGEPLANFGPMWSAVERMHNPDGLALSARHLTISTVGIVPGIRRLASAQLPVNLAVSLHAANDELRNELVPINRTYPLDRLMEACRDYVSAKGRRLSFEWALIENVNDSARDAGQLAARCEPLGAHVNLIPLNTTPGYPAVGTSAAGVRTFRDRLISLGVNATIRRNRGTGIDAACGQLRATTSLRAPHATSVTMSPSRQ